MKTIENNSNKILIDVGFITIIISLTIMIAYLFNPLFSNPAEIIVFGFIGMLAYVWSKLK